MTLLSNKTILITKSKAESEASIKSLINEGAVIVYFPTIKINPIFESDLLKNTINIIDEIDYVIFRSTAFNHISHDSPWGTSKTN